MVHEEQIALATILVKLKDQFHATYSTHPMCSCVVRYFDFVAKSVDPYIEQRLNEEFFVEEEGSLEQRQIMSLLAFLQSLLRLSAIQDKTTMDKLESLYNTINKELRKAEQNRALRSFDPSEVIIR